MMPYECCLIYGPYTRKDKRMHVIVIWPDNIKTTVSYPKFYMEQLLGRYLTENEEVHHKDENEANNDPDNFEVVNSTEHRRKHKEKYVSNIEVICFQCDKKFELTPTQQKDKFRNRYRNKAGPFCSRRCSGLFGKSQQ